MNQLDNRIAVIGLGYVGLPLAALCARKGYATLGFDLNARVVASLQQGKCHFRDDTVETSLAAAVDSGNLVVSSDIDAIAGCTIRCDTIRLQCVLKIGTGLPHAYARQPLS